MKTSNMPYAKYVRRKAALERLTAASFSLDHGIKRYSKSPMGQYEMAVLDERIKDYAELGRRPSTGLRG